MADTQEQKQGPQYPFYVHDQYIKDLSFENPNFLMKYSDSEKQPQVSVNVESNVAKINDSNYEVSMKVQVKSEIDGTSIFVLELDYGSLVSVDPTLNSDILETVLLVHCPFLMFPFVREIVSSVTRSGGYPPLLIEPIDFASLYMEKKKATQAGVENVSPSAGLPN